MLMPETLLGSTLDGAAGLKLGRALCCVGSPGCRHSARSRPSRVPTCMEQKSISAGEAAEVRPCDVESAAPLATPSNYEMSNWVRCILDRKEQGDVRKKHSARLQKLTPPDDSNRPHSDTTAS